MESELVAPNAASSAAAAFEARFEARFAAIDARFSTFENRIPMMVNAISKLQETIPAMIAQQIAHSLRPSRRPGVSGRPLKPSRRTPEVDNDDSCSLSGLEDAPLPVGRMVRRVSNKRGGLRCKDALRLAHAFVTSRVLYSTPYLHLRKFDETALEVLLRKMYKRALDLPMNTSNQRLMGLGMCAETSSDIFHMVWACQSTPNLVPKPNPTRKDWEAALLDCSDLASQKAQVDRARAAAFANGLLY
ncbi:hypothetical protein HPB47_017260 [Ixodes persulcatus]|uniref:Uncharacterized protein n=1 Tax=Ixodes persulcatus TaxID=34615 RepID=A0AC60QNS4_IXOPE|nr:hypothetical protein HPB47_017260 [Ixodes persulcatus]